MQGVAQAPLRSPRVAAGPLTIRAGNASRRFEGVRILALLTGGPLADGLDGYPKIGDVNAASQKVAVRMAPLGSFYCPCQ